MTFGFGRGFAEVQILKRVKLELSLAPNYKKSENSRTEWTIVMKLCIYNLY